MEQEIKDKILELLKKIGLENTGVSTATIANQLIFSIETTHPSHIIGLRGDTIYAIDYLIKKLVEKGKKETPHFVVDVDGYRSKNIKEIQQRALVMAERARSFQYNVELTPMNAYERLVVHEVLSNSPNVTTESVGEGKERRVVIKYNPA
ncbi:MAG: R3H domain-containing nucleic acid-binding protein [Patescibacteria group bacterium]